MNEIIQNQLFEGGKKKLVIEEEGEEWEKVFTYSYTKFNDMYVIFVSVHSIRLFIIDLFSHVFFSVVKQFSISPNLTMKYFYFPICMQWSTEPSFHFRFESPIYIEKINTFICKFENSGVWEYLSINRCKILLKTECKNTHSHFTHHNISVPFLVLWLKINSVA